MVVQPRSTVFRCFRQHDHGLLSGALARAFRWPDGRAPSLSVVLAIAAHDIGWTRADAAPAWCRARNRPHDFTSLPLADRVAIYEEGVDAMERLHPYAGVLGSTHFSGFVHPEAAPAYLRRERARRDAIAADHGMDDTDVARDYALLKALDLASLVVCLAAPGSIPDERPPWLTPVMRIDTQEVELCWDGDALIASPSPFAEPVRFSLQYADVERARCADAPSFAEAWAERSVGTMDVLVR